MPNPVEIYNKQPSKTPAAPDTADPTAPKSKTAGVDWAQKQATPFGDATTYFGGKTPAPGRKDR
jgi:hypothetical protein